MKNIENNGERMDINFYNMNYDTFDMYQKSHYKRYELAFDLIEKSDIVADMACGSGYGTMMLSRRAKEAHGFDISQEAINEVSARYLNEKKVNFVNKNLLDLDVESKFDKIVSFETIEHFLPNEIPTVLKNMHKALKPEGTLIFSTPYNQIDSEFARIFHRTFYITEDTIQILLKDLFSVEQYYYQNYSDHTAQKSLANKDFIICVAKKITTNNEGSLT